MQVMRRFEHFFPDIAGNNSICTYFPLKIVMFVDSITNVRKTHIQANMLQLNAYMAVLHTRYGFCQVRTFPGICNTSKP